MTTVGEVDNARNGFDPHAMLTDWETGTVSLLPDGRTLREFDIAAVDVEIEIAPGLFFPAWTYNGRVPGPTLRVKEGDRVVIRFANGGSMPHTLHFHGIHSARMDGVPGAGEAMPGEAFVYEFDANRDGRVAGAELPDRMQDIVRRGDRNGDAALDGEEVRAIASSSTVIGVGTGLPPPTSTRRLRLTVRRLVDPGLVGLIDDLQLPQERRDTAIAALTQAEEEARRRLAATIETLRDEVRALVSEAQFAAFDTEIQALDETTQTFLAQTAAPAGLPTFRIPTLDIDDAARSLQVTSDVRSALTAAVDRQAERTRVLATDRSALLSRLAPVLTAEELTDFGASLQRHRAILARPR
jgi:hypothetical protein